MIVSDKEIYILTAPYYKTGGTELCHQLVYTINRLGGKAYILYKKAEDGKYLNPAFEKYVDGYKILTEAEYDNNNGIIVIPESETLEIQKFKKATIYLWWMSVDNYYRWQNWKYVYEETGLLRTIKYALSIIVRRQFKKRYLPLKKMGNVSVHLAQSDYAVDFLKKNGFTNIEYLSDFINDDYVEKRKENFQKNKEKIVIYNPSKGLLFTKKIIKKNKDIEFVPLVGMDNSELISYMSKAKVYIDFGAHPGKDRMPREAAVMGCCIVTGKRGSAAYNDVSIPEKYKIQDKTVNIPEISRIIRDLLDNYDERTLEFEAYRDKIVNEKNDFFKDTNSIFVGNKEYEK